MALDFLPTAVLCDVAPEPIAMLPRVRRVWRATLAGPAVTVRTLPGELASVIQALNEAQEGDVLVVDCGGSLATALFGDRLSRVAVDRGLAGLVVDGAVRDADGIEELGFPVFAAGIVPNGPGKHVFGEVGIPIECGGRPVSPGDFVYGDGDGVVVVPAGIHDEVVARARILLEEEAAGLAL